MALSKKEGFPERDKILADLAKALAHPARIAILRVLARRSSCICGEIVDELPLSQSTVSQHLKALKEAGLIQGEIDGPKTCYCLSPAGVTRLAKLFPEFVAKIRKDIERNTNCC